MAPNFLQCPECVANGWKSRVRDHGGTRHCLGWYPYYDENGHRHAHDPNELNVLYSCANGHSFTRTYKSPCPNPNCDYGKTGES